MKNSNLKRSFKLSLAAIAVGGCLVTSPITFAAEEEAEEVIEKIQVTGSRIKRADMETSSPVTITSAEDIKIAGFTRVEDLLNNLPQIEAASTAFEANGASGRGTLDLRGLGSNRTLVLVNGRRMQPGGGSSGSADVNSIPSALIKRVEVMTGGGSSVYGSDAIAGVVNFVMDNEFEGIKVDVNGTGYQHNNDNSYMQDLMDDKSFDYPEGSSGIDGKTFSLDISAGSEFADGKGHAVAFATYKQTKELRQSARDYSSCALHSSGTRCNGSSTAVVPNFFIAPIGPDGYDYSQEQWVKLTPDNSFSEDRSDNVYNYAPINHFMRPDEKFTFGTFLNYEINDTFRPYMELMYMRDQTKAQIAESGTFYADNITMDVSNPLVSDAQRTYLADQFGLGMDDQFGAYIGKRNVEGGPRTSIIQHDSFRIVLGTAGDLSDNWTYDASIQVGSTTNATISINDLSRPKVIEAVSGDGTDCASISGCVPYEVFTYQGVTPEQAKGLTSTAISSSFSDQFIFSAFATGDLDLTVPGADSPIAVVVGTEYRKEEFEYVPDQIVAEGALTGMGGPSDPLQGSFSVKEIYGEANIPLVADAPMIESLVLELGYRYSDYDLTGGQSTYKVALDWTPIDDWKVRAGYNRAVRAPNIGELFAVQSIGLWSGTDNCAGATPAFSAAQCANTGVTADQYGNVSASPANQYNSVTGGNKELSPEIADTYTFGIVGQISDDIDFSIDYWSIEIEQVIGAIGEELTIDQCATTGNAAFCDNITRSPTGNLWQGQAGSIQATSINLANRKWEGIDISTGYRTEALGGDFSVTMMSTFMMTKEYTPLPGDETATYDCSGMFNSNCFPQPEWRSVVNANFDKDDYGLNVKLRYYGEVEYDETVDELLVADGGISAQAYLDVAGRYMVNDNITVRLGINNLLDKERPLTGGALGQGAFYDQLGRYLHAGVSFQF
ncbi:TonB-dependent receptor [Colwellia sp. PAMC 20917]|uniref:TonB-dependent receptor domain-containing protein n=1 Tax=Colwellia sp. PAMC 20917 TaxID=1816218 RepID=UPI000878C921|nr:TonB-dependent receptor [Colwellia sp. PAMC 20917]AOW77640.1 TonB-dependent receptor [Colwellia sp. PAMC 20917]